ncbi:hypothetical protein JTE90_021095 [Oedothorax gibbosus]|uniref:Uncharacterized protein n=1 Tax=Oedothorax gibbosus TaxID=931172 RepID=A0AAV6TX43_9ARAC|nr:hypothetical protein JTE90_021095 [Oedothorax gibbosus]
MGVTCDVGTMFYVLPMLLGRTYDMQHSTIGMDVFRPEDIDKAVKESTFNPVVHSEYVVAADSREKSKFLGIQGDLALKVSAGLVSIKGAGEYLRDTSNANQSVEVLIKLSFISMQQELSLDAKPISELEHYDRSQVGTHVVKDLLYGGEVYASVNFVALRAEDKSNIEVEILAGIQKQGAFNMSAQGKLEKLAQNISSRAKVEIKYFATVPLESVPTTIEGLGDLVRKFSAQVENINNKTGVPLCAGLRPLSDFDEKFEFLKNTMLEQAMEEFNDKFVNLREAKSMLRKLVSSLPDNVDDEYMKKILNFSARLSKTLVVFHDVIGNLDLEQGVDQLNPANQAFDENSEVSGFNTYTKELKKIIDENKSKPDPTRPRSTYVRWGKRSCGTKSSNALLVGFMSASVERGNGAGINYLCLPENPETKKMHPSALQTNSMRSIIAGARYSNFSVFHGEGKKVEGKGASCTVCETPMRPTVRVFPAVSACPGDWVQEYVGFIASQKFKANRVEAVCVDEDPDSYDFEGAGTGLKEPVIIPMRKGGDESADSAIPCAVCSK